MIAKTYPHLDTKKIQRYLKRENYPPKIKQPEKISNLITIERFVYSFKKENITGIIEIINDKALLGDLGAVKSSILIGKEGALSNLENQLSIKGDVLKAN